MLLRSIRRGAETVSVWAAVPVSIVAVWFAVSQIRGCQASYRVAPTVEYRVIDNENPGSDGVEIEVEVDEDGGDRPSRIDSDSPVSRPSIDNLWHLGPCGYDLRDMEIHECGVLEHLQEVLISMHESYSGEEAERLDAMAMIDVEMKARLGWLGEVRKRRYRAIRRAWREIDSHKEHPHAAE